MLFTRKPQIVEAYQLTKDSFRMVAEWCHGSPVYHFADITGEEPVSITIQTNHGPASARLTDWVVKGHTDFYPVSGKTFGLLFEPVASEDQL